MKNIFRLSLIVGLIAFATSAQSQVRTTTRSTIQQGYYLDYPGSWLTAVPAPAQCDTLGVSDSVSYIIPITHLNDVDITHEFFWTKYGSASTTLNITFYQGSTPWEWTQLTSGVAKTAYTKQVVLAATTSAATPQYTSFKTDSVNFTGRYLRVTYITTSTASAGGKIISRTKTTIK